MLVRLVGAVQAGLREQVTEISLPYGGWLRVLVLATGMAVLGAELAASRLMAPFFGSSLLVWANVVGLILLYLSAGYWLGGRLADRYPDVEALYHVAAVAAIGLGLVPSLAYPLLSAVSGGLFRVPLGVLGGSFVAVLALFSVPLTLFGCVSPWAVRLSVRDVRQAGRTAGSLYAISTIGSLIGAYLTALVLIPTVGTRRTFLGFSVVVLLTALSGLILEWRRGPGTSAAAPRNGIRRLIPWLYGFALLALVALTLAPTGSIRPPQFGTLLYEGESAYNYIQVVRTGTRVDLLLDVNEGEVIHSTYDPTRRLSGGEWDYFLVAPFFASDVQLTTADRILLLGSAAGTTARELTEIYGPLPIDGVELDPTIVDLGREYFAMTLPNLRVFTADARVYLRGSPERYRVIGIDTFRQLDAPFHLTTVEFFAEARDHLTSGGVVAVNVFRPGGDDRLVRALARTMAEVFPTVFIVDVPDSFNSLVVGTDWSTTLARAQTNVARFSPPALQEIAQLSVAHSRLYRPATGDVLLTDDKAPVEQLTDAALLAALSGALDR